MNEKVSRNEEARTLVEQYMDRIYGYVVKRVSNLHDVEDLVQEICLNLYDAAKCREIYAEYPFVWTTVKHTLANYYRQKEKNHYLIGMDEMRKEPVDGTMGAARNFFRSALSENIVYAVYDRSMTVEQIAEALAVSPVYVESELEFLEEYSLVLRKKDHYTANILIDEETKDSTIMHQKLYEGTARKIACKLYDAIAEGGYLDSTELMYPDGDKNFAMWALILYLLAWTESNSFEEKIKFQEVADRRADGGWNIITASINTKAGENYIKENHLDEFCGPCWNDNGEVMLWLLDGDWSAKRVGDHYGGPNIQRDLNLLQRFWKVIRSTVGEDAKAKQNQLSEEEYAYLCQKGYIKKGGDGFELNITALTDGETKKRLIALTCQIKNEVLTEAAPEIEAYRNWVMNNQPCPSHLRKQREFGLQFLFHADGWFMLYAQKALVESGKLRPVREEQRLGVSQILLEKSR